MTYKHFEDLPVWQAAIDFALRVFDLTDDHAFTERGDLADQLRRASLSISNNIAEGFERGTTPELLMFLYIARGSSGEARSQLRFCLRRARFSHLQSQISDLIPLAASCTKQIHAWCDSLQNSAIKGQRHLNTEVRETFTRHQHAEAFLQKLRAATPHMHHPPQP